MNPALTMLARSDIARRWATTAVRERMSGERGEGVISTAIVVLIVASIAALMWIAFNTIWSETEAKINTEVGRVGTSGDGAD